MEIRVFWRGNGQYGCSDGGLLTGELFNAANELLECAASFFFACYGIGAPHLRSDAAVVGEPAFSFGQTNFRSDAAFLVSLTSAVRGFPVSRAWDVETIPLLLA